MSSRRDRQPTGRSNAGSYDSARSNLSDRLTARSSNSNHLNSARNNGSLLDTASLNNLAIATDRSDLSVNEVLRRIKEKIDSDKNNRMSKEIEALGPYNSFSRPRVSKLMPLRSVLLDPSINNFPPSKTRTELLQRIRVSGEPHPSYDLDNDGYVSQEDYRLAKRFDLDGNGVLDPNERLVGKHVLAEEFFERNKDHLNIFGGQIAGRSRKDNVDKLVSSYSFERSYQRLLEVERTNEANKAKMIQDCIRSGDKPEILKHNFYTNKFDTTAWNDLEAIPRKESLLDLSDHGGSRRRLLFTKKEQLRNEVADIMLKATFKGKQPENYHRVTLITDPKVEND